MKKGTKCVVQTINLSNPKTCVKPKVQRLVSAEADSFPKPNPRASDYSLLKPVAVKICSWKDVQKTCPPKLCESPPKSPPFSTGFELRRAVVFLVKSAIMVTLVSWTCTEGLWSGSAETEDMYCRMMRVICPDWPAHSPDLQEIKYSVFGTYNQIVMKGMDIIVSVPREVYRRLRKFFFSCDTTEETEGKSGEMA